MFTGYPRKSYKSFILSCEKCNYLVDEKGLSLFYAKHIRGSDIGLSAGYYILYDSGDSLFTRGVLRYLSLIQKREKHTL